MEYTVSTNAKATADLKAEVGDAIAKIDITLKEEQTKDNSSLIERPTIVHGWKERKDCFNPEILDGL